MLHDAERLALRGGVTLRVEIAESEVGLLSDDEPLLDVELEGPAEARFMYISPDGEPGDVAWSEPIGGGDSTEVIVQPWRELGEGPTDLVLAWQRNRSTTAASVDEVTETPLTVVSPLWWNINNEALLTGKANPGYVTAMHELGIEVWPAVQGLHADGLHTLITDAERRRDTIERLSSGTRDSGADGFNIDLEGFRDEDAEAFSVFVEELAAAVHEWGGVVSYDLVPRSDSWDVTPPELAYWSTAPQRRRIAAAVDYTVLMAYDQHNRFRPGGPVAAPSWVEEMIVYQLRYSDPHTVILGIPAYGRLWDPAELDAPRALGFGDFADLQGERSADEKFGMDRIDLEDGRFFWVDFEATPERVALGRRYGLSGVAIWRLGFDDERLWTDLG